jgi:hypothetical protein
VTVAQALHFEQKHAAHQLGRHFGAGAAGVRHEEVDLQLRVRLGRNADIVQRPKPGIDAVNGLVRGRREALVQVVVAGLNTAFGLRRQAKSIATVQGRR